MDFERLMLHFGLEFCIKPGWVISKNDGQRHWVGRDQLMRLYNVRLDHVSNGPTRDKNIIYLYPQDSGEYDLQKEVREYLHARFRQ